MISETIELKDDFSFESCLSSDFNNRQEITITKNGEFLANFVLKPISYGDLMEASGMQQKDYEAKALSSMILAYKIKTADGFKKGQTMTMEEVREFLPNIMQALSPIAAKLIYVTKAEEKNSVTQFSG